MSKKTVWRGVVGYENFYEVSEDGQVRRKDTGQLRAVQSQSGIPAIGLSRKGVRETKTIATIVAAAFIGRPSKGSWVYHLDGNPMNNHWRNLAYRSQARATKLSAATAKLSPADVLAICGAYMDGQSYLEIAHLHNVSVATIRSIIMGRTWKHVRRPPGFNRDAAGR